MFHRAIRISLALASVALTPGCGGETRDAPIVPSDNVESATEAAIDLPDIGLMTSLPLYWPAGAELHEIASGSVAKPWQRVAIEQHFDIVPLDTLSPIPGLAPGDPETDPLADLDHLAIIQPRGLSPADNVALDQWVRGGGKLLLVLDPLLTGEYDFPLGDPRRPVDAALIPPVVARWGLSVNLNETQDATPILVAYPGGFLVRSMAGEIGIAQSAASQCEVFAEGIMAQCRIGEGQITLVADAAVFEIPPAEATPVARVAPAPIPALLKFVFG